MHASTVVIASREVAIALNCAPHRSCATRIAMRARTPLVFVESDTEASYPLPTHAVRLACAATTRLDVIEDAEGDGDEIARACVRACARAFMVGDIARVGRLRSDDVCCGGPRRSRDNEKTRGAVARFLRV